MAWDNILRSQLLDRRQRLETAIAAFGETANLVGLLREVDSTLERMDAGLYGLCEGCQGQIEEDRLLANPLVRTCLGCLTEEQQRALEEDLDMASRIQSGLLPKSRNFAGWEFCFHYAPAGVVSGDYCDLVGDETEPGGVFFMMGDVSGKGVAASLLMAHLHAMFRSLIGMGLPVNRLVQQANRVFCESTVPTHFATLVCGRARNSGEIEICNAGHCPPLLIRRDDVIPIDATGLPVGVFATGEYDVQRFHVTPSDTLLLYTDGLSEATDGAGAEYGAERLSKLARMSASLPPQALITACLDDLAEFCSGLPARDDLTVMAIRRAATA